MNLQLVILRILKLVHPRLMTTGTLWSEVVSEVSGASYTNFRAAMLDLEQKGQVVVITGEDKNRAKITDAGLARLLEL